MNRLAMTLTLAVALAAPAMAQTTGTTNMDILRQKVKATVSSGLEEEITLWTSSVAGEGELRVRNGSARLPQQPKRFGRKLPDAHEPIAAGEFIHLDQLQHTRSLRARVVSEQAGERELIVVVVLHPDHYARELPNAFYRAQKRS